MTGIYCDALSSAFLNRLVPTDLDDCPLRKGGISRHLEHYQTQGDLKSYHSVLLEWEPIGRFNFLDWPCEQGCHTKPHTWKGLHKGFNVL